LEPIVHLARVYKNIVLALKPLMQGFVIFPPTPARRWGLPAELVGTAIYLASAASDFVNGQVIYVDGGILASL